VSGEDGKRLWNCHKCKNILSLNSNLELRWRHNPNGCCYNAMGHLRSVISQTAIEQVQLNTMRELLLLKIDDVIAEHSVPDDAIVNSKPDLRRLGEDIRRSVVKGIDDEEDDEGHDPLWAKDGVRLQQNAVRPDFDRITGDEIRRENAPRKCPNCDSRLKPVGDFWVCRVGLCDYETIRN